MNSRQKKARQCANTKAGFKRNGVIVMHEVKGATTKKVTQRRIAAVYQRYGCSIDEWEHGKSTGLLFYFRQQRNRAKQRGIEWRLSYKQWIDIWVDSGHLSDRGRGAGTYCMARKGDSGSYSVDNVYICKTEENSRDALTRDSKKEPSERGVFEIYKGMSRPWVAKYGNKLIGAYKTKEEAIVSRNNFLLTRNIQSNFIGGRV